MLGIRASATTRPKRARGEALTSSGSSSDVPAEGLVKTRPRPQARCIKALLVFLFLSICTSLFVVNSQFVQEGGQFEARNPTLNVYGLDQVDPSTTSTSTTSRKEKEEHVDGVRTDETEEVGQQSDEFAVEQDETESVSLQSDEKAQKGAGEKPEQATEAGVQAGRPRYHGWEACQLLHENKKQPSDQLRGHAGWKPDGSDPLEGLAADAAECLRSELKAHAADAGTSREDSVVCKRMPVGEENAGHLIQFRETHILEWNVTESGDLPDARAAQDAWQQDQVVILRGGAAMFGAYRKWTDEFLSTHIAPNRQFMVRRSKYNDGVFHFNFRDRDMVRITFDDFLRRSREGEALYLAETEIRSLGRTPAQNRELLEDLYPDPRLARLLKEMHIPIHCKPERFYMWTGKGDKVNPLHHDPYSNMLVQLLGTKTFTLFGHSQRWWLYPLFPPHGHESSSMNDIRQVDPAHFPCFKHATSLEVTLHAGDVLLLPSDWWHQVHTTGHSLAINYWWGAGTKRFCEPWP